MADVLLDQLLGLPGTARRDDGSAAMLRDLWLGGMPLPRAAAAAGLSVAAAEETLRRLGLNITPSRQPSPSKPVDLEEPGQDTPPRRPWRRWTALRADVVRLYAEGRTIRAIATELEMHQREVWRQLDLAGVARRPRGTSPVVLSPLALKRLYLKDGLGLAEIARRFDVSPDTVARNLERHGLARRDPHAPLDPDTLRRLYVHQQLGVRAVAARLGVSADKIRAELARSSIPIRPPGRPARPGR